MAERGKGPARSLAPTVALALALAIAPAAGRVSGQDLGLLSDYPTAARADYIFGCMAVSGQTRAVLEKCACSIDVVSSILPYDRYVEAEAVLSVRQAGGERTAILRNAPAALEVVAELRRAQAEAEIRCFF